MFSSHQSPIGSPIRNLCNDASKFSKASLHLIQEVLVCLSFLTTLDDFSFDLPGGCLTQEINTNFRSSIGTASGTS